MDTLFLIISIKLVGSHNNWHQFRDIIISGVVYIDSTPQYAQEGCTDEEISKTKNGVHPRRNGACYWNYTYSRCSFIYFGEWLSQYSQHCSGKLQFEQFFVHFEK